MLYHPELYALTVLVKDQMKFDVMESYILELNLFTNLGMYIGKRFHGNGNCNSQANIVHFLFNGTTFLSSNMGSLSGLKVNC